MPVERPAVTLFFGAVQRAGFYETLAAAGVSLGLVKDTSNVQYHDEPEGFEPVVRVDFQQGAQTIATAVEEIRGDWDVDCLVNIDEVQVPVWAEVCELLGLPAMSRAAATAVRSKSVMRRCFDERIGSWSSCRSVVVASVDEALAVAATIGYPVVVKPGNLQGSFFVSRCESPGEVYDAWAGMKDSLPGAAARIEATGIGTQILVEEFLEGTNHSVDCLVMDSQVWSTPVIDVLTGADLGGDDFHHFARSTASHLATDQQHAVRELAEKAALAVGVRRGALHVEIVHGPSGPRLIEVGGRPGANRPWLLRHAFGIDLMAAYRDVLCGRIPDVTPSRSAAAAYVTPFPSHVGTLRALDGLDRLLSLPSYVGHAVNVALGDRLQPRRAGAAAPVRLELAHDSAQTLREDLMSVERISRDLFVLA